MGKQLYPLIYKPGILKDGTLFQGDYCTDGQWVRFRRGNVRKIGGMKGLNDAFILDQTNVSNITVVPNPASSDSAITYLPLGNGQIKKYQIQTSNFTYIPGSDVVLNTPVQLVTNNYIWKTAIAIQDDNQQVVFVGSPSRNNINTNVDGILYYNNLNDNNAAPADKPPILEGLTGVLFVNPYLFVYGSNGRVQWTRTGNKPAIRDFGNKDTPNIYTVGSDKVLDVRPIRGGVNSPTLLCWTLTSVVRLINVSQDDTLKFQKDVLSTTCSTLSSRCVVEWDGIFFWPGTNKFYTFNGIVSKLDNNINLDNFYANLDLNNRQLVFGVRETQYDEIWWYYPEKGQPQATVKNTRAIIYNVKENTWYDTAISRDAGTYSEDYGFMITYGESLTTPDAPRTLYRHEYEKNSPNQLNDENIQEQIPNTLPGAPANDTRPVPIPSRFTTPVISWAAFNPMKQLTGIDKWMDIITIEPDFALMPQFTDMTVTLNTRQYAQDFPLSSIAYKINAPLIGPIWNPNDAKTDVAFQGRQVTLTFRTTCNFEMGHVMMLIGIGDGQ